MTTRIWTIYKYKEEERTFLSNMAENCVYECNILKYTIIKVSTATVIYCPMSLSYRLSQRRVVIHLQNMTQNAYSSAIDLCVWIKTRALIVASFPTCNHTLTNTQTCERWELTLYIIHCTLHNFIHFYNCNTVIFVLILSSLNLAQEVFQLTTTLVQYSVRFH